MSTRREFLTQAAASVAATTSAQLVEGAIQSGKDGSDKGKPNNSRAAPVLISGATIIDGTGGAPVKDGTVLVDGGRIVSIGVHNPSVPANAHRIDARGKYVIPGLIDAHVWLMEGTAPMVMIRFEGRYDELAIEAAQLTLKNGVTTVFDTWGPRDPLIKARDAINRSRSIGSRIHLSGNWIGLDGPFSTDLRQQFKVAVYESFAERIDSLWEANVGQRLISMSPEQVRQEIRAYVQSGVDYLSYAVSDHHIGATRFIVFSPRVQRVIVEEAHRAGLPACGFRPATGEAVHLALEAGVDVIQAPDCTIHQPLPEEVVTVLAERQVPCIVEAMTSQGFERFQKSSNNSRLVEILKRNHQSLVRAGASLLLGTGGFVNSPEDTAFLAHLASGGTTKVLGEGHFVWFEAMQEMGMKPMTVLMAATCNVAKAYKLDKELGTLERGKLADLLVLDRDPLEKAGNYRSISLVMKEGRIIDRQALPAPRLLTAEPGSTRAGCANTRDVT